MNISAREKIIFTMIGAVLLSIGTSWILAPANLIAAGLTGIIQVLNMASQIYLGISLNIGVVYFIANIPLIILAYKKLNKKYMYYSVLSIVIQTIILAFPSPLPEDFYGLGMLERTLVGGTLIGIGIGVSLKVGSSTGGFDILFQYITLKRDISFNTVNLIINSMIIMCAVIINDFAMFIGIYTFIRLSITVIATSFSNRSYNILLVRIFTNNPDEIAKLLLEKTKRGVSLVEKTGAYTGEKGMMIMVYMNRYELRLIRRQIFELDDRVMIGITRTEKIMGNFEKRIID